MSSNWKDCVQDFDIDIDISDRNHLYDYATCKTMRKRPEEKWSQDDFPLHLLGDTNHVVDTDENMMMQIRQMDKAINDTGFFQKKGAKENEPEKEDLFSSNFESFGTSLDLPRRVLPMYKPGENVKGTMTIKVSQPIDVANLTINFTGQATVNVRIYHRYGYYDDTRHEKYIDETVTVWEKAGTKSKDVAESFTALTTSNNPGPKITPTLEAGTHTFPFEFKIPMETSQSTPNLRPSHANFCHIIYRIKAKVDSGSKVSKDLVTHKGLWVTKEVDIGDDLEMQQPVTTVEKLDTGMLWTSGNLTVKAMLPSAAFVKGTDIPLELEIENQTKAAIDKISAFISMHGKYKLSDSKLTCSQSINVKGKKVYAGEPVAVGMNPHFKWVLPWDFSESSVDSDLMPTGTLDDCKLIDVRYDIMIKLKRGSLHRNMELEIPIFIGSYNSRDTEASLYPKLS